MQRLVKDMLTLIRIELPGSFSKKRIIANFMSLYLRSIVSKLFRRSRKSIPWQEQNVKIESSIWQSFNHIIAMYIKYLSPRYLLQTYVIRGVASGWHSQSYIDHLEKNFTEKYTNRISPNIREKIDDVATAMSREFTGLEQPVVKRWLSTYQYGLSNLATSPETLPETLEDKLKDTLVIELGAGTGANAAVHASLSDKGVYIFDIPPMLQLQKQIMEAVGKTVKLSPISYFHEVNELLRQAEKQPYIVVSYWAFTEFPENLRKSLDPLIENSEFSFFACNSHFEGVKNLDYFNALAERLGNKTVKSEPIDWSPYKNHSYIMVG